MFSLTSDLNTGIMDFSYSSGMGYLSMIVSSTPVTDAVHWTGCRYVPSKKVYRLPDLNQ